MIAVDTSALVAILFDEEDAVQYIEVLEASAVSMMAAASYVELCAVIKSRSGPKGLEIMDRTMEKIGIAIEPVTVEQAQIARAAYVKYGVLNFGDVFSYALAKDKNLPLLFKGEDFKKTDIQSCL